MAIPVTIEFGNHVIHTQMHALPRPGDQLHCAFPASGVPKLWLRVALVSFHQTAEFEGRTSPEPFHITITTQGDPDPMLSDLNNKAMITASGLA